MVSVGDVLWSRFVVRLDSEWLGLLAITYKWHLSNNGGNLQ